MKKTLFFCIATALFTLVNASGPKDFPKGGVSVDFSKTFKTEKSAGKNLLFDGDFETKPLAKTPWDQWQNHYYIHAPKHELPDPGALRAKLNPLLTQKIISGKGGKYLELSSPKAIMKYRPKGKPMLSNRVSQYVDLPVLNAPTKFQLLLRYRGKIDNVPGLNAFHVFAFFKDNLKLYKSKDTRKMVNHGLKVSGKWTTGTVSFIAPPNTRKLGISLALYGCGQLFIDDVKLVKTKAADGVVAKLIPCSFLDKVFVLSQNDPAVMAFAFKNEKNTKINKPYLYLKLPEGFEVVDVRYTTSLSERKDINKNGKKYTVYKIDVNKLKKNFGKERFNTYILASVMVKSSLPAGAKKYPASYWYQDGKYQTEPENIEFKIIPEIKSGQPKIFQTGAMVRREGDFTGKGVEGFIDLYKKTGFNIVHGLSTAAMNAAYKKAGILRYTQPYYLCNGYRIGTDNKPDNVKFQLADGSYRDKPHQAICPVAVYKQDPYYRQKVLDRIKDLLVNKDSSDSIMPNWEPYMFDFKGCFCPRCKEEFIKYSGLDKIEVDKAWPSKIIVKYKDKWVKFRSWQHAQLCIQLEKDINKIGKSAGKDSHFVPEIAWSQLLEDSNPHFAQYNPKDYMDKLPILELWGPYIFYKFDEPYVYNPGIHLITYTAAKDIKKFITKHIPDASKRPKTIAFPHGYQLDSWVTEPEALAFETLCFFLNGWEGSIAYVFPKGYDNRWWKAMGDANKRIAEYEDFVFKGEKINASAAIPVSPVPTPNFPKFWSEGGNFIQKLPSLKTAAIIQTVEYKLGDKHLIAVGNFWQKGEAFVKLSVDNLQPSGKYVLREPDYKRCFSAGGSTALTARQLKKGITVHVGALRWAFFVVEPYRKDAGYGEAISSKFMQQLLKKRLPEIEKAVKWGKKYQAERQAQAARDNALPDYSNIKNLNNKEISCCKVDNTIEFNWKDNKVIIDPATGGRVKSWFRGKTQLVSQDGKLGFCLDAFWWPSKAACQITSPYKVVSQNKTTNGLNLVLERKLTPKDKLFLTDCVITKIYDFSPGNLKVTTKITNTTGVEKEFSFRWHNMPALLEFHGTKGGEALLTEKGKKVVFKRLFARKMLRYAAKRDADLEGLFKLEQAATISKPEVIFSSTWSPVKLTAEILSEKELYGIVLWDSGKQKTTTFEPLFKKATISTGKSWSASMLWKVN
jgi:hypothetical protein